MAAEAWVTLGVGVFAAAVSVIASSVTMHVNSEKTLAEIRGAFGERLNGHDREIGELKDGQTEIRNKIEAQGNKLSAIERACELRHNGIHPHKFGD